MVRFRNLVPCCFVWKAEGMNTGDWPETCVKLRALSTMLKADERQAPQLEACRQVLIWGGNRDWSGVTGAWKLLTELSRNPEFDPGATSHDSDDSDDSFLPIPGGPTVLSFLRLHKVLFYLAIEGRKDSAVHAAISDVKHMNSMLSKVHSLYSSFSLPIYDSRVAGAIGTIVETWRRQVGQNLPPDPDLMFPAIEAFSSDEYEAKIREVHIRYPNTPTFARPVSLRCDGSSADQERNARHWAEATVSLYWWMKEILGHDAKPEDFRWLEASLFMAGYDVNGINRLNPPGPDPA